MNVLGRSEQVLKRYSVLLASICINPLNWTTAGTPADRSLNLGAVFFSSTGSSIQREIPEYAGARVDRTTGALVTTLPEDMDVDPFPPGVYHKYDYVFWYRNLKDNVRVRCESYLKKQTNSSMSFRRCICGD